MESTAAISNTQSEENGLKQNQEPVRPRSLRFVEEGVKTQYSGVFNVGFGAEEVMFIFGNPSLEPNIVRIESKIAVSIKTAKRIALTLGNLIRRYEAVNGVVAVEAPQAAPEQNSK